jgi:hypothetical protein
MLHRSILVATDLTDVILRLIPGQIPLLTPQMGLESLPAITNTVTGRLAHDWFLSSLV